MQSPDLSTSTTNGKSSYFEAYPRAKFASTPRTTARKGREKEKTPTPTKEKKMRFPSFSSRSSKHSRARSSGEVTASTAPTSELGEQPAGKEANGNGKDTVSSRFSTAQRQKRTSLFGKLKDVFHHPKNEAST